eukprot:1158973-Pelagomonas_calceolata.AAC.17
MLSLAGNAEGMACHDALVACMAHPVDAVRATAIPSSPGGLALAHHDVVLILHLALPVRQDIFLNELPNCRHTTAPGTLFLELVLAGKGGSTGDVEVRQVCQQTQYCTTSMLSLLQLLLLLNKGAGPVMKRAGMMTGARGRASPHLFVLVPRAGGCCLHCVNLCITELLRYRAAGKGLVGVELAQPACHTAAFRSTAAFAVFIETGLAQRQLWYNSIKLTSPRHPPRIDGVQWGCASTCYCTQKQSMVRVANKDRARHKGKLRSIQT